MYKNIELGIKHGQITSKTPELVRGSQSQPQLRVEIANFITFAKFGVFLQRVQKPHKKSPLDTTVKAFLLQYFKRRYSKNTAMATKIDEVFANNLMDKILLLSKQGLKLGLATPDGERKAPDGNRSKI